MKTLLKKLAFYYLAAIIFIGMGIHVMMSGAWPSQHINQAYHAYRVIKTYLSNNDAVEIAPTRSADEVTQLSDQLGLSKSRRLVSESLSVSNKPLKSINAYEFNPLRTPPQLYFSHTAPTGYRIVYGVFLFNDRMHGALLIDSKGEVIHRWLMTDNDHEGSIVNDGALYPHGLHINTDGSVIFAFDGGSALHKISYCSALIWSTSGQFNSTVNRDGETVWAIEGEDYIVQLDESTGDILHKIEVESIINQNPEVDILGLRQIDHKDDSLWDSQRFRLNDVEPLPDTVSNQFEQFETGDLLLSFRSLNLLTVIDPVSLKIKWWRAGAWRRQNDPDWGQDGLITVFNNNLQNGYSSIDQIDPDTMNLSNIVSGKGINFYSGLRGSHQLHSDDHILFSSPQQGRVLELDSDGNIQFEFVNFVNADQKHVFVTSDAVFLEVDYFDSGVLEQACPSQ